MKIGDKAFVQVSTLFDIREVEILDVTPKFYKFKIPEIDKVIRRGKSKFNKSRIVLIERNYNLLVAFLKTWGTTPEEVMKVFKMIDEEHPELLL